MKKTTVKIDISQRLNFEITLLSVILPLIYRFSPKKGQKLYDHYLKHIGENANKYIKSLT